MLNLRVPVVFNEVRRGKGNSVLHSVKDNKKNNTEDICNNKAKTRQTALGLFFDYLYLRSTVSHATLHAKETAGDPLKALVSHTVKGCSIGL